MYIIEGNIGVGKSSFLELLAKHLLGVELVFEPVNNWADQKSGQSLLSSFYTDPARWSYTMETYTMMCRARIHINEQTNTNPRRVFERSIYSGHFCFAKNGYENGYFSQVEWTIYEAWINFLLKDKCKPPLGFIYLQASPEVCFERIKKRARPGEEGINLEYLAQINKVHEKFLVEKDGLFENLKNVPVLTLDCSEDFISDNVFLDKHLAKVESFINI